MNISKAARSSGLPARTLRYYEEIGLVIPDRSPNGYRSYSEADVHRLAFVQRSRAFGFSIEECRVLLSLYTDNQRASADVKQIALAKVDEIDGKIRDLRSLRNTLRNLAGNCHGDHKPDCPILDDLAGKTF